MFHNAVWCSISMPHAKATQPLRKSSGPLKYITSSQSKTQSLCHCRGASLRKTWIRSSSSRKQCDPGCHEYQRNRSTPPQTSRWGIPPSTCCCSRTGGFHYCQIYGGSGLLNPLAWIPRENHVYGNAVNLLAPICLLWAECLAAVL